MKSDFIINIQLISYIVNNMNLKNNTRISIDFQQVY